MNVKLRKIEVKATIADALEARATERGISVSDLLAELANLDSHISDALDIAELDRRWSAVQSGAKTVDHETVVRWLDTWGTPAYRPLSER